MEEEGLRFNHSIQAAVQLKLIVSSEVLSYFYFTAGNWKEENKALGGSWDFCSASYDS